MGHFSYTCQLSGLPITSGIACGIIPMLPRGNFYDNSEAHWRKYGTGNFCSNEGENLFFNEIFYPIFGEYNEYGSLENIIKDDNTKSMELFFELSIEDIVTVLTDGRKREYEEGGQFCDSVKILKKKNPRHMMLLKTSITWLHKGLYDKLASINRNDYFDKLDLGSDGLLKHLGFKFVKHTKKERYNLEYEKDGLKIDSDGHWINVPKESIYNLHDFEKYCKKNNVIIDISEAKDKSYFAQVYDYVLPDLTKLKSSSHLDGGSQVKRMLLSERGGFDYDDGVLDLLISLQQKALKLVVKKKRTKEEDVALEELNSTLEKVENKKPEQKQIPSFLFELIKKEGNNFLRKNIIDWFAVKPYYYITGRYLYPIGTSPQDGDWKASQLFFNCCSEVVTEEMKERVANGYEDE